MARASQVLRVLIAVATGMQVALGLYVWWTGNVAWLPAHLGVGLLLIAALWITTLLASRARVGFRRCLAIVVLTLLLPIFGMAQMIITAGPGHWVLITLHMAAAGSAISMSLRVGRLAQVGLAAGGSDGQAGPHAERFSHANA